MPSLNLGCGMRRDAAWGECVTMDIRPHVNPDVVHDANHLPWPFSANEFDNIYAFDIIEHLRDVVAVVNECHRIVKPDGMLYIHTNHYRYENAFRDPTHIHFFALGSFDYWDPSTEYGQRYGWYCPDAKFKILEKRPDGQELFFKMQKI